LTRPQQRHDPRAFQRDGDFSLQMLASVRFHFPANYQENPSRKAGISWHFSGHRRCRFSPAEQDYEQLCD
jgi:hypothetical protein